MLPETQHATTSLWSQLAQLGYDRSRWHLVSRCDYDSSGYIRTQRTCQHIHTLEEVGVLIGDGNTTDAIAGS
jgi:hypothetical protein